MGRDCAARCPTGRAGGSPIGTRFMSIAPMPAEDGPAVPPPRSAGRRIAFLLPDLNGGGVQRIVMILAGAFAGRGAAVDLVVCDAEGHLRSQVPEGVRLVSLEGGGLMGQRLLALRSDPRGLPDLARAVFSLKPRWETLRFLGGLSRYLRDERPEALFAATPYINMLAILARRVAGVPTRIVVSERTHFSTGKPRKRKRARQLSRAMGRTYAQADAIVAVSKGVADDLATTIGIARDRVTTIHNPTLTPDFRAKLDEPIDHPWFAEGQPPVLLAVGRLGYQKDFATLVRAFGQVRRDREARLVIIGDGGYNKEQEERRRELKDLAAEFGVADDLDFPGYIKNPMPYMKRAGVFVLSSRFEGFPNVLLEALGSGAPVVSTDCPSGPREILDGGAFGPLVPVEDAEALAAAIVATLDRPPSAERQMARAAVFGYEASIDGYEAALLG